jgi:hypothetical protein
VKEISRTNAKSIKGFGASDCKKGCMSHLYYVGNDFEATLDSILDAYDNLNLMAKLLVLNDFDLPVKELKYNLWTHSKVV